MPNTTRLALRYPLLSDTADVPRDVGNLAADIDDAMIFSYGVLVSRPVSASGTPGIRGRTYYANDQGDAAGELHFDYGTGWRKMPLYQTDGSLWMRSATTDTQPALKFTPSTARIDFGPGGATAPDTNLYRSLAGRVQTDGQLAAMGAMLVDLGGTAQKLTFGSAADTNLYRGGADVLASDDTIRSYAALQTGLATDTIMRFSVDTSGVIGWGPGGATARDTNLYRSTVGTLKTDGSFVVGASAQVQNNLTVDLGNTGSRIYFGSALDASVYRNAANSIRTPSFVVVDKGLSVDFGGLANALTFGAAQDVSMWRNASGYLTTANTFAIYNAAADANPVMRFIRNGTTPRIDFGPGGATVVGDTNLYRRTAGILRTDGALEAVTYLNVGANSLPTTSAFGLLFGSAADTNLYRSGTASLKTDGSFTIGANLAISGGDAFVQMSSNGYMILQESQGDSYYMNNTVRIGGAWQYVTLNRPAIGWFMHAGSGGAAASISTYYAPSAAAQPAALVEKLRILGASGTMYVGGDFNHSVPSAIVGNSTGSGTGYTLTHPTTGKWVITLTNAFNAQPNVFVSIDNLTGAMVSVHPTSATTFEVYVWSAANAAVDQAWNFLVIYPS